MKRYLLIVVCTWVLLPNLVRAADLSIFVDTRGQIINALEGTVLLSGEYEVSDIQTGNSAIVIWINKPAFDEKTRTISFSGFTPGGFSGERVLFNISGGMDMGDYKNISFRNVTGLLNDGEGSKAVVSLRGVPVSIEEDSLPPEPFTPLIAQSEDIFEGARFVSFDTQDKGSGVAYYMLSERMMFAPREGDWVKSESPHRIEDKWLIKKVYIKAVDGKGNAWVEAVALPNRKYFMTIFAIIIGVLCVQIVRIYSRWRSSLRSS